MNHFLGYNHDDFKDLQQKLISSHDNHSVMSRVYLYKIVRAILDETHDRTRRSFII